MTFGSKDMSKSEERSFLEERRASFKVLGQDHVGTDARIGRDYRMEGSQGPVEVGLGKELR